MKITLYGLEESTCTQRVLILLNELELPYNFQKVDLFAGEHKQPEYLLIQPFGKIPALQYNKKIIFESRAIIKYLAKQHRTPHDRIINFNTDMWLEIESQNYGPCVEKIVYEKLFKQMLNAGEADEKIVEESLDKLKQSLSVYEQQLQKHDYIAGDHFTIADISHIPYTYKMIELGFKDIYKNYPHVYNWIKRIIHKPTVKKALKI